MAIRLERFATVSCAPPPVPSWGGSRPPRPTPHSASGARQGAAVFHSEEWRGSPPISKLGGARCAVRSPTHDAVSDRPNVPT
eukprot:6214025-Alexandrium_andersonii.AAC.1